MSVALAARFCGAQENRERHQGRLKAKRPFASRSTPNHSSQQQTLAMGLRSPLVLLLLLLFLAATFRPSAAALAPPTGSLARRRRPYLPLLKCGPIGAIRSQTSGLPVLIRTSAFCAAGSIVKQLSSVVRWPRAAPSTHGPKQPGHPQYAGESPSLPNTSAEYLARQEGT